MRIHQKTIDDDRVARGYEICGETKLPNGESNWCTLKVGHVGNHRAFPQPVFMSSEDYTEPWKNFNFKAICAEAVGLSN